MNNFERLHEQLTESRKYGDSGYEALVIDILDDNGIDASFDKETLLVGRANIQKVKAILKKSMEVDSPRSVK